MPLPRVGQRGWNWVVRAAGCGAIGWLTGVAIAFACSYARVSGWPTERFDHESGSMQEVPAAALHPRYSVGHGAQRRGVVWLRTALWDSVTLARLAPHEWAEWGVARYPALDDRPDVENPPGWAVAPPEAGSVVMVETVAYGWPARALRVRGQLHAAPNDSTSVTATESDGAFAGRFPNPFVARPAWGMAWIPLLKGSLINALVFGVPCWLAWTAAARLRSAARRRRGLCVTCGYRREALPENAPCPECGQVLSVGARRRSEQ